MKVMGPRVLVRKLDEPQSSKTLIVGVSFDEPQQYAEIVATGVISLKNGSKVEMDVKPGEMIVTKKYCGTPVQLNAETLYFLEYEDMLAVLEA